MNKNLEFGSERVKTDESTRSSFDATSEPPSPNDPLFKVCVEVIPKDDKTVWVKIVVVDGMNAENRSSVAEKVMFCKAVSHFYKKMKSTSKNDCAAENIEPHAIGERFLN